MRLAATDPHKHQLAPANTGAERLFGTSLCFHDKKNFRLQTVNQPLHWKDVKKQQNTVRDESSIQEENHVF